MKRDALNLRVATHAEVVEACRSWHYSQSVPASHILRVAVTEHDRFIGVVLFSRGANNQSGKPFGLEAGSICELTRIALDRHDAPVSRIVRIAVAMLRKHRPEIKLIVSYADPDQGHHGGVYQAGNWACVKGLRNGSRLLTCPDGVERHPRTASGLYGTTSGFPSRKTSDKHKYIYVLDQRLKPMIESMRIPCPHLSPCVRSIEGDAPRIQRDEGGSIPTRTLPAA